MSLGNLNKISIALTVLSFVIFVASVAGIDRKLLMPQVDKAKLSGVYDRLAEDSLRSGIRLTGCLATSLDSKFVIAEIVPIDQGVVNVDGPLVEAPETTGSNLQLIRLSGILTSTDQSYQAIVNKSLVREGSMVYGCKVLEVTADSVSFNVNGATKTIKINGEIRVAARSSRQLTLNSISVQNGVWVCEINDYFYRSGDWMDDQTQIRAVTPSKVMISRAGKMIILEVEDE